jgi:gliding motility-associated-like protein
MQKQPLSKLLESLLLLVFIVNWSVSHSQNICDGNLGENIFADGNFGSGSQNWLPFDPGIAPGYIYQTNPPPDDGFYMITNDIGDWPWVYDTWLQVEDNSTDPDGYMMVVNASFDPGIFYENIVDNLCENTLYEFTADIINLIRSWATDHNDPNVDFLLDDVVVFSTGTIPKNESWNKYGFTFTTNPGQTSLKLSLRNNAPGGIGNDLALDNISFRACGPSAFVNAETSVLLCENGQGLTISAEIPVVQFVQWQLSIDNGVNWADIPTAIELEYFHQDLSPGIYLYRYLSATTIENLMNSKCRIISDIFSVEVLPITFEVERIICEGDLLEFGTQELSSSGTFIESFISESGCDSIVTLNLEVRDEPEFEIDYVVTDPACQGLFPGSIQVNNVSGGIEPYTYSLDENVNTIGFFEDLQVGSYTITIVDSIGCEDSFTHLLNEEIPFFLDAGSDFDIKLGESVFPIVNHNYSLVDIEWSAHNDISCSDCIDPEIFPLQDGEYILTAENDRGCVLSDTILVRVDDTKNVFIPNSFSPNQDGINDVFEIYSQLNIVKEIKNFLVYDRWGNMIFDGKTSNTFSWDGTFDNRPASLGMYVYFIEIEYIDSIIEKLTGSISITL